MANTYPTTQFPLGSTEVKVLFNNASNFDDAMNSELPSFYDRFNKRRETWAGMQKMVADFIEAMGFEATHLVYVDGTPLTVLRPTQLIDRSGSVYKVKMPANFPVNLTGTWATDQLLLVDVGDASLRFDLATQGAAIVFGAQQTVESIAALRLLLKTSVSTYAFVLGYYTPNGEGGGPYWLDSSDNVSADNGSTVIVAADGGRWKLAQSWGASMLQGGAAGDGVTDDTVACQAVIDACKGRRIVVDQGKTFYVAGLTLSGTTYNNTEIQYDGWMKMKPDAGASTFGGAWVGLLIKDCDGIRSNPKFDGNRTAMTQREQIFCIGIAGASNVTFPTMDFKELRGDGLYVGQSTWTSSGTIPVGIKAGRIVAINSVDDGRNAVTINSVNGFNLDVLISNQVGALVNGFIQPGGLDVEPDFGYQICTNIRIGYADVVTAGTNGVGVFGKSISGIDANRDWNCFDIIIEDCRILKTGTTGAAISATQFSRCADVQVKGSLAYNSVKGQGVNHDYSQRVHAKWRMNNVTYGVVIGAVDSLNAFDIELDVSNFSGAGARVTQCSQGRIYGRVAGANSGASGVQCHNQGRVGITLTDVAFSVDAPYDGTIARAFRNEPGNEVAFGTGTLVRNCDWSGYPSFAATNDAAIRTENVLGYTNATAVPSSGTWFQGVFVKNDAPASVSNKTTIGWARANSGSNNVVGTDWYPCVVTNS